MIQVPEDRRPPLSPQLALRVAVIGGFALAMFAIIFFRLWFLQVLSGDQYLAQAAGNRVRNIDIPSARGQVLDRHPSQPHGHARDTALMAVGGVASGRRR